MITKMKNIGTPLTQNQMKNVKGGGGKLGPGCVVYGGSCSCTDICCDDLPCLGPLGGLGAGGHCGVYIDPGTQDS